jgi:hypothetical protein
MFNFEEEPGRRAGAKLLPRVRPGGLRRIALVGYLRTEHRKAHKGAPKHRARSDPPKKG